MDDLAHARGARVEDVVEALLEQLCGFGGSTADNWIAVLKRDRIRGLLARQFPETFL